MPIIEWDKKYSVKNRKIDSQHKRIVNILNQIYDLQTKDKTDRSEKIMNDLIDYIRHHFSTEEEYLKTHNYPDFDRHKLYHDKFINKFCDFQKKILIDKSLPVGSIFNLVWDWFSHHILVIDKRYQQYIDENK